MPGWFSVNAPTSNTGIGGGIPVATVNGSPIRPALPGPTGLAPSAPGTGGPLGASYAGGSIDENGLYTFPDGTKADPAWITPEMRQQHSDVPNTQGGAVSPSQGSTDYQSQFMAIMGGLPATPANLAAKEQELQAAGIQVKRNAEGTAGKIKLPTGQIVDVIQGAGAGGGGNWQWLTGGGGAGGGGFGGSLGNFQTGTFTGGGKYPLASVMGEGLAAPWTTPFNAPDPSSVTNDKALQWQMGRGMDAIQRSAAAKGTLLTGGALKSLDTFGQGLASTYYGDVYNRALGEYKMAHDIYTGNQDSLYNRLFGVAGLGQNAAANVGNAAGQYGAGASNTLLGQENAAASGTAAGGAAIGNAVQNIGNLSASVYQQTHQPQVYSGPPQYNPNWTMTYPDQA